MISISGKRLVVSQFHSIAVEVDGRDENGARVDWFQVGTIHRVWYGADVAPAPATYQALVVRGVWPGVDRGVEIGTYATVSQAREAILEALSWRVVLAPPPDPNDLDD